MSQPSRIPANPHSNPALPMAASGPSAADLWEELHRPPPPLAHPIPRLSPPPVPRPVRAVVRFLYRRRQIRIIVRPADEDSPSGEPSTFPRPLRLLQPPLGLLALLALLANGCTVLNYTSPSGERFSRTCLGAQTALNSLDVDTATNGLRHLTLHGYQDNTAQALGTVTEAAVRAALTSTPK